MKSWIRITLVIIFLIGSVAFFGYWSVGQFNQAFDNLSNSYYLTNTHSAYRSFSKPDAETASTSPEIYSGVATSTDTELVSATSTVSELSLTFPKSNTKVYVGCNYNISWEPPTTISLLESALIDGGTRKAVGPGTSGLAKENIIEKDSENLNWKVGVVWPGEYYIKVSKINGIEKEIKSKYFTSDR